MIPSTLVRAEVVDIRDSRKPVPSSFLIDANVLYFLYYPNFTTLQAAGGKVPVPSQQREYPTWWQRSKQAGTSAQVASITLGEFVKLWEYAEFEAYWLAQSPASRPPANTAGKFSTQVCKACRYAYPAELVRIRNRVKTIVPSLFRSIRVATALPNPAEEYNKSSQEWCSSAGDYPDSVMVAVGKHAGITDILSDDADLLTYPGICVYTANQTAINAARAASKLR